MIEKPKLNDPEIMRYLTLIGQVGFVFVCQFLFFFFFAYWIINRYNFHDMWLLVGILIGLFSGFYTCYQLIKKVSKE